MNPEAPRFITRVMVGASSKAETTATGIAG
jgi:hypothetical protein